MNRYSGRKKFQRKISCGTVVLADQSRMQRFILFSFVLIAMLVMTQITSIGRAMAATSANIGNGHVGQAQKPAASADHSYRVAAAANSMEGWQRDAFLAIDLQKRLDALAFQRKQKLARSQLYRRAERRRGAVKKKKALVNARTQARLARKKRLKQQTIRLKKAQARLKRRENRAKFAAAVGQPARLQHCLKKAGYFSGRITGQVDEATQRAYRAFREDLNLSSRSNDINDTAVQKALFSKCLDNQFKNRETIIAKVVANKAASPSPRKTPDIRDMPVSPPAQSDDLEAPLTTASISRSKKQARLPAMSNNQIDVAEQFASDVLVATDETDNPRSAIGKNDRVEPLNIAGRSGSSSSFSVRRMERPLALRRVQPVAKRLARVAAQKPSLFSRRLRISDLASIEPVSANTCSPKTHKPAPAMDGMSIALADGPVPRMNMAPLQDDGPVTTGSISASSFGKPWRRSARNSNRLVKAVQAEKTCLPQDLYDLLASAHGQKAGVVVCAADCLPAPASFSRRQKELFAKQYSINWCGTGCLGIADPLPLREVMKIERQAQVHVCMTPQWRLSSASNKRVDRTGINKSIRALFDNLPGGYGNENNIAVLIGNKNYGGDLKKHASGHIDVAAMKALLLEQLGYRAENIILVKDARRADLVRLFGRRGDTRGELQKRLKANPDAQLMVYYSGHASSSGLGLNNYLLPVDTISGIETRTAYSLNVLYDNLRELDARSTQLFLEAGFAANRGPMILPPNIAERRVNIAPLVPVRGLAIFSAATGDQKPLIDPETGLGLFTHYLVGGLAGAADKRPIGNGDRTIDSVELHVYLASNVRLAARKTLGLRQNPTLSRSDNLFLSQLSRRNR